MKKKLSIDQIIAIGEIKTELELERISLAERKLRVLAKKDSDLKSKRNKLRTLISNYESKHWRNTSSISDSKIKESDKAEQVVNSEMDFIDKRKKLIKSKLKRLGINQQEFGKILGHDSKSYTSELMNGIAAFTLKDLIIISKLLRINLDKLIPTQIDEKEKMKIEQKIKSLGNSKIRLNKEKFSIVQ